MPQRTCGSHALIADKHIRIRVEHPIAELARFRELQATPDDEGQQ
jgi:hypothetical protein